MTLWFLGLLFHVQHLIVLIEHYDTGALQLFYRCLLMAHDARGLLLVGVIDKLLETEVEDVVSGDDEEITLLLLSSPLGEGIYCQYQVADGAEAGFVGIGAVVDDADGFGVCLF